MKQTLSITRKELESYFSSPMALIFVGVFLAVTLFTFFWVDGFWGRNLADVRPLFRWLPVLMIFLVAALTMRQWSEEQQSGTLEILLTMPMRIVQLVLGKFLAVLALVAVALALTLFLPISIATLGSLDLGPVIGGYLAAVLLAGVYIALGLFVSSRTDNQIVALILTVILGGLLHLIGSATITNFVGASTGEFLRALGTSSRFESIERGVIDLRDLLYYGSLIAIFLALNVFSLDSRRWGTGASTARYRFNQQTFTLLLIANLLIFNVLLSPLNSARADLTADKLYSLSDVTKDLVSDLQEPLLIRGYFSEENHPLLAPLIPQIRDTLEEYRIASGGNITVEILDPITNPELEAEANQTYGIRATPMQIADRSGSAVRNVYFDLLIRYGDQSETLNFQDLIEIDQFGNEIDLRLRNLEYDLTSRIQRAVSGFRSIDAVLAALDEPAELTLFITPSSVPEIFADVPATIERVAAEIAAQSEGNFRFEVIDLETNANISRELLASEYNIRPIPTDFFGTQTYYLHMALAVGDQVQVLPPSGQLSETELKTAIESGLKRVSSGFLQVVGLWRPSAFGQPDPFTGQMQQSLSQYNIVQELLSETYEVRPLTLDDGFVPTDIDVLVVIAPQDMSETQLFAVDQYLMRGGAVFVAAGNYKLGQDQFTGALSLDPITGGMAEMLAHYGVTVEQALVMDTQNEPFPAQTQRDLGGFTVQELQAIDYPPFVDVRPDGMNRQNSITASLPAVTIHWASPVTLDETLNAERETSTLLSSTSGAWTTTNPDIQPNQQLYPEYGFPIVGEQRAYPLAVTVEGRFSSFFTDRPSPFAQDPAAEEFSVDPLSGLPAPNVPSGDVPNPLAFVTLEESPPNARLIVVGSAEFLNDTVFQISSQFGGDRFLNSLQFLQNSVDWFTEDSALADIRTRGTVARVLKPLSTTEQDRYEAINYGLAILSVLVLGLIWNVRKRGEKPIPLILPDGRHIQDPISASADYESLPPEPETDSETFEKSQQDEEAQQKHNGGKA